VDVLPPVVSGDELRDLTGVQRVRESPQPLHVLLRHRLLLQPHSFAGFVMVAEDAYAADLAIYEFINGRDGQVDWNSAGSACCRHAQAPDYPSVINRVDAVSVKPKVRSYVIYASEVAPNSVRPSVLPLDWAGRCPQHDVLRAVTEISIDLTTI